MKERDASVPLSPSPWEAQANKGAKVMKERLKKIMLVSPLKITALVILIALVLFFVDAPFLRFMELKSLDLRMVSRGAMPSGGETVIVTIDEIGRAHV